MLLFQEMVLTAFVTTEIHVDPHQEQTITCNVLPLYMNNKFAYNRKLMSLTLCILRQEWGMRITNSIYSICTMDDLQAMTYPYIVYASC